MDTIETETVVIGGQTYRMTIYPDGDSPNPLDDWSEIGRIISLNRKHRNFDPDGVQYAIEHDPDAVPLSYYEHGRCLWSVAGELPVTAQCPWDSVAFAGIWLPDAETLASAHPYGGRTRRHFMRKRARQACAAYSQWCDGEIYGYEISRLLPCDHCGCERMEAVDACWGFYGLDACREAALAAIAT